MCLFLVLFCLLSLLFFWGGGGYLQGQHTWINILSVESQKGHITIQRCSFENQKGAIDIDIVQHSTPLVLNRTPLNNDSTLLALNWRYPNLKSLQCPWNWKLVVLSRTDFFVDMSVKFHPDSDNCRQNNGQNINAVMLWPKSKLEFRDGSSELAGETVVGWASSMPLHSLDSMLFANSRAFLKAYFIYTVNSA